MRGVIYILLPFLLISCRGKNEVLFNRLEPHASGISFENILTYTEQVNPYTYKNFYNGGGVGIGDINNDGLPDIFFCGNQASNKLYLNKGHLKFEDITLTAGLASLEVWSAGVSMVDLNADGLLDIYVCKSGPPGGLKRHNELFINNGDLTFREESAKYGLNNEGLSSHAAFFDYDRDGDLDCYLLNNSIKSVGGYDLIKDQRNIPDSLGGNKLLRNDDGFFNDITAQSGIYSSDIGFGLGVTIGDINQDNWPDIYVSNDFFERDYLYINNQNGSFSEVIENYIKEMSMGSMGADFADINNDAQSEIFVTEMLPERHDRLMSKAIFETWDKHQLMIERGYGNQFGRNVLQLNNGDNTFSEISRYAGVEATDWSWGALIFDMDNDGLKDIFVANGIYKDLLDLDYVNFMSQPGQIKNIIETTKNAIKTMIDLIPSEPLLNYAFQNQGDNAFKNRASDWGMNEATFTSGSAYGDLDNDGDLDLVINNVNMPSWIYENQSEKVSTPNNHLTIKLLGIDKNVQAIGSKVKIYVGSNILYQELNPFRGFESTIDSKLVFGLGQASVDSIQVIWPNGYQTSIKEVASNELLIIDQNNGQKELIIEVEDTIGYYTKKSDILNFKHIERPYVDFDKDRLIYQMSSTEGPCLCKGDVNHDGLEDVYLGGASGQSGALFNQKIGGFSKVQLPFEGAIESEEVACAFFDANRDGHLDLYVASGSSEFESFASGLSDHLYFGDGTGGFKDSHQALPVNGKESTSTIVPFDFDQDGDMDLFVGGRQRPNYYGVPIDSYLLQNDGAGTFIDVSKQVAPDFIKLGMITDALAVDLDGSNGLELVIVGQWMSPKIFKYSGSVFVEISRDFGLDAYAGLYNCVATGDVNADGAADLIFGNQGTNTRFHASKKEPLGLLVNDFDQNSALDLVHSMYFDGVAYPLAQLKELSMQLPKIKKNYLKFNDYKSATLDQVFGEKINKGGYHLKVTELHSFVWLNDPKGNYKVLNLPFQTQLFPVYDILLHDFNADGHLDMLAAGNFLKSKPEMGSNMAGFSSWLEGDGTGQFSFVPNSVTGIKIAGEVRSIEQFNIDGHVALVFGVNNEPPQVFFKNHESK